VETPGSRRRPPAHHRGREYSQHAAASLNRRRRPTNERLHDQSELHCYGRAPPRRVVPRIVPSSTATEERIHVACAAMEERRPAPPRHAPSSPMLVRIGPSFVSNPRTRLLFLFSV
jgi:hypothetical protein